MRMFSCVALLWYAVHLCRSSFRETACCKLRAPSLCQRVGLNYMWLAACSVTKTLISHLCLGCAVQLRATSTTPLPGHRSALHEDGEEADACRGAKQGKGNKEAAAATSCKGWEAVRCEGQATEACSTCCSRSQVNASCQGQSCSQVQGNHNQGWIQAWHDHGRIVDGRRRQSCSAGGGKGQQQQQRRNRNGFATGNGQQTKAGGSGACLAEACTGNAC